MRKRIVLELCWTKNCVTVEINVMLIIARSKMLSIIAIFWRYIPGNVNSPNRLDFRKKFQKNCLPPRSTHVAVNGSVRNEAMSKVRKLAPVLSTRRFEFNTPIFPTIKLGLWRSFALATHPIKPIQKMQARNESKSNEKNR